MTAAKAKRQADREERPASDLVSATERDYWQTRLRARLRGQRKATKPPPRSRLSKLAELFALSAFEIDVVATLWTTAYAPGWRAELVAHEAFGGQLTVMGIASTFGHVPRARLASESPIRLWRIVIEHPFVEGTAALSLDPHLFAWLDGEHELDRALIGHAGLLRSGFELDSWKLEARSEEMARALQAGERLRVHVIAADVAAALAYVAALARRLGLTALHVRNCALPADELHECAVRVQRLAFLDGCAPCWHARDAEHAWPDEVASFPLQFVVGVEPVLPNERMRDIDITLADPDAGERRALWLSARNAAAWPPEDLDDLALRFEAASTEILRAAATAPSDAREAALRLRECAADDLQGLAQRLICPFIWDDLVVPAHVRDRLEDIAFEARERERLWAQPEAARLYPQGRGLVALLAGPPGTGKTMSAQVIAAELGLDLLRVDISRILSKWVGETAQHLQKVLASPCSRRALLLFDEADAFFGRRIEDTRQAQDHFVNMDLSHLMIALESYSGVVLLATNLKANIDAAFMRRIRHAIDFPMPDAKARAAIWTRAAQALLGAPLPAATRDAIARVARIEASGAQIKNAALSAAFASRRASRAPDAALFGAMLARELAKDGAGMSARELATTLEAAA